MKLGTWLELPDEEDQDFASPDFDCELSDEEIAELRLLCEPIED